MPRIAAWLRTGWWVADAPCVLTWPYYMPATVSAHIGRRILAQYQDTHRLMLRQAGTYSQFDVFWRRYLHWHRCRAAAGTPRASLDEPNVWFGRVQHDVFFALVSRDLWPAFLRCTGINVPTGRAASPPLAETAPSFTTVTRGGRHSGSSLALSAGLPPLLVPATQ
jgi:hypothetical protein